MVDLSVQHVNKDPRRTASVWVRILMFGMLVALSSTSTAGYYSDKSHSCLAEGRCHHTVTQILDPGDDFVGICMAFMNTKHDGRFDAVEISYHEYLINKCQSEGSRTDGGQVVEGYMCDAWSSSKGYKECIGEWWYITMFRCGENTLYHPVYSCLPVITVTKDRPRNCDGRYGNPVDALHATKSQREVIGLGVTGADLTLQFESIGGTQPLAQPVNGATAPWLPLELPGFGPRWSLGNMQALEVQRDTYAQQPHPLLWIHQGRSLGYSHQSSSVYASQARTGDRLISLGYLGFSGWRRIDPDARRMDVFDTVPGFGASGKIHAIKKSELASGGWLSWQYSTPADVPAIAPSAGLPIGMEDHFGRRVALEYTQINGQYRVSRIVDASGESMRIEYDSGATLASIVWPDSHRRVFHHDMFAGSALLTGITDENQDRHSSYSYAEGGQAISTSRAGGASRFSLHYQKPPERSASITFDEPRRVFVRTIEWSPPEGAQVTDPGGISFSQVARVVNGRLESVGRSQPAGSGCSASVSSQSHDTEGRVQWLEDFNGQRTCFSREPARGIPLVTVEGLAANAACSVTSVGAALPSGSRKTSTQWHPDWNLQTKVAEPGRIVTKVYNGQPDPFNAGATASCAPASAQLMDGKPIVVLCKEVQQATTDTTGAQGFSAPLDSSVAARIEQWTYNGFGQVLTHDGPRTDVLDRTVYEYYPSTTADYTLGDLKQVTNPAGHITRYPRYNKAGKPLQMIDPNGIATDYSYDLRQRLKTVSVAGALTTYDYYPTGLLKQVTEPDQSYVRYAYDAAHRLTDVSDERGNRVHYELDNAGNRRVEQVTDPQGQLRRKVDRVFDALNRLELRTGRE